MHTSLKVKPISLNLGFRQVTLCAVVGRQIKDVTKMKIKGEQKDHQKKKQCIY